MQFSLIQVLVEKQHIHIFTLVWRFICVPCEVTMNVFSWLQTICKYDSDISTHPSFALHKHARKPNKNMYIFTEYIHILTMKDRTVTKWKLPKAGTQNDISERMSSHSLSSPQGSLSLDCRQRKLLFTHRRLSFAPTLNLFYQMKLHPVHLPNTLLRCHFFSLSLCTFLLRLHYLTKCTFISSVTD